MSTFDVLYHPRWLPLQLNEANHAGLVEFIEDQALKFSHIAYGLANGIVPSGKSFPLKWNFSFGASEHDVVSVTRSGVYQQNFHFWAALFDAAQFLTCQPAFKPDISIREWLLANSTPRVKTRFGLYIDPEDGAHTFPGCVFGFDTLRGGLNRRILLMMAAFILGHELGHYSLGHFRDRSSSAADEAWAVNPNLSPEMDQIMKDALIWNLDRRSKSELLMNRDELEADSAGLAMAVFASVRLDALLEDPGKCPYPPELKDELQKLPPDPDGSIVLAAVVACIGVINSTNRSMASAPSASHPSNLARLGNLLLQFTSDPERQMTADQSTASIRSLEQLLKFILSSTDNSELHESLIDELYSSVKTLTRAELRTLRKLNIEENGLKQFRAQRLSKFLLDDSLRASMEACIDLPWLQVLAKYD